MEKFFRAFLAVLACAVLVRAQGDTPITGATVELVTESASSVVLEIENRRSVPLESWTIAVSGPGGGGNYSTDANGFADARDIMIAPGEKRLIKSPSRMTIGPDTTAIALAAVFTDGAFEGDPGELAKLQAAHQQRADEARFLLKVIDEVRVAPDAEALALLRRRLSERAAARQGPDPFLGNVIRQLTTEEIQRPPGWTRLILDRERAGIEASLAQASRPNLAAVPPSRPGTRISLNPSVGLRVWNETTDTRFAIIRNLRDVAIEAWRLDFFNGLGSKTGARGSDCASAQVSSCAIGPRGTEKVRIAGITKEQEPQAVKLALVMFADRRYEGSAEAKAEVESTRDAYAADLAYWIPVLETAAAKPPAEIRSFLAAKMRERQGQPAGAGQSMIQALIEIPDQSLQTLPNRVNSTLAGFKDIRQRLAARRLQQHPTTELRKET